jgi:DNA-binding MarR family transcriptional regulator
MASARGDVAFFAEVAAVERLAALHIERLLPGGLTNAQFALLGQLSNGGAQAPAALAAALAVSKATMSSTLQKLEVRRLISVAGDEGDGRRKRVSITMEGERVLVAATAALRPLVEDLRRRFPAAEFDAVLPLLRAVRAWLGERA